MCGRVSCHDGLRVKYVEHDITNLMVAGTNSTLNIDRFLTNEKGMQHSYFPWFHLKWSKGVQCSIGSGYGVGINRSIQGVSLGEQA